MSNFEQSGVELLLDSNQYERNLRRVLMDADRLDGSFDGIIDSANAVERAINGIDGSVNMNVAVNDADIDDAVRKATDLDTNRSFNVDANESDAESALDDIVSQLDSIKDMATIDLAIQLTGAAADLLNSLQDPSQLPLVGSIFEMDTALAQLEGTTGRLIPQADKLINDLYTDAWGDSRTEIAEVIKQASLLGIENENLEEAVRSAFDIQATGIADTDEALRTMQTMVRTGLSPDFKSAADVIVTGFQTGANRGDDLLDTLNEYGTTFSQLKISGQGALALINSGLAVGIDNSDRVADAVRETGIRLKEIGTDKNIQEAFTRLDELSDVDLAGTLDAYNAGEISGDEFFTGFFAALGDAAAQDTTEASAIAATLVGTIAEDFGIEATAALTPVWDETMGEIEGRAETASDRINDTLGVALTGLGRTIEQEIAQTLNEAFDFDQVIEDAKAAVAEVGAALREGRSLGEAIEIGFDLEDSPIRRIESMLNAVALGFLEAIAGVLDVVGRGDLAGQLREQVTEFAGGQLAFDLQIADGAEGVTRTVSGALARGVDEAQVGESVQQAIDERLAAGDIAGAQAIADGVKAAVDQGLQNVDGTAFARRIDTTMRSYGGDTEALLQVLGVDRLEDATTEALAGAVAQIAAETEGTELGFNLAGELKNFGVEAAAALASVDLEGATADITTALDEAQTQIDTLVAGADEAYNQGDFDTAAAKLTEAIDLVKGTGDEAMLATLEATLAVTEDLQEVGTTATETEDDIETALDNTEFSLAEFETASQQKLAAAGSHFSTYQSSATTALAQVDQAITNTSNALDALRNSIDNAPTGIPDTPPQAAAVTERAVGGPLPAGVTLVGEEGPELITSDSAAGFVINAASTNAIMQAVATALGGGGMGGGGNTYVNMYNTINTNNQAAADAFGLRTATVVRGFAT